MQLQPEFREDSDTTPIPLTLTQASQSYYPAGHLWFYRPEAQGGSVRANTNPGFLPEKLKALRVDIVKGLTECFRGLREKRADLDDWIDRAGISKCLVRHVTRPTGDYKIAGFSFAGRLAREQLKPAGERKAEADVLVEFVEAQAKSTYQLWDGSSLDDNRYYLLENANLNGKDYLNMDIPSWYKIVLSRDILASDGAVAANFADRDADGNTRPHYYSPVVPALLQASLDEKLPHSAKGAQAMLKKLTKFLQLDLADIVRRS
jgi:hypothetical protein